MRGPVRHLDGTAGAVQRLGPLRALVRRAYGVRTALGGSGEPLVRLRGGRGGRGLRRRPRGRLRHLGLAALPGRGRSQLVAATGAEVSVLRRRLPVLLLGDLLRERHALAESARTLNASPCDASGRPRPGAGAGALAQGSPAGASAGSGCAAEAAARPRRGSACCGGGHGQRQRHGPGVSPASGATGPGPGPESQGSSCREPARRSRRGRAARPRAPAHGMGLRRVVVGVRFGVNGVVAACSVTPICCGLEQGLPPGPAPGRGRPRRAAARRRSAPPRRAEPFLGGWRARAAPVAHSAAHRYWRAPALRRPHHRPARCAGRRSRNRSRSEPVTRSGRSGRSGKSTRQCRLKRPGRFGPDGCPDCSCRSGRSCRFGDRRLRERFRLRRPAHRAGR